MPNDKSITKDIWQWLSRGDGYPSEKLYDVTGSTKRNVSDKSSFSNMGGTLYVDKDATPSNVTKTWGGNITDQYFNWYNFFNYYGARDVEFSVSSKSYTGYGKLTTDILTKKTYDAGNNGKYENGYELNMSSVLNSMRNRGIYKLEITSKMNWNGNSVNTGNMSQTYKIIRKEFALEQASVITSAYSPMQDNNFHNMVKEYRTFTVRVPVRSMDNYNANTIASSLASRINSKSGPVVKIYYDKTANNGGKNYITPSKVTSTGRYIDFVCTAPDGFANADNVGITAVIENPSAIYSSQTYKADNYSSYISKNKVDTKGVTFTLKDKDDNVVSGFDTYKKEHIFKLDITNGNPWTLLSGGERQEGNFSYRLYNKNNMSDEIPLVKHNGLASTTNVAHAGNSEYRIAADGKKVEGEYVLKISARDFANNEESMSANVKLDTIAPRADYKLTEVATVDGAKRYEYKFSIEDKSNTGRLYYAFVRNGEDVPDTNDTKPETSGPEDTYFEKWGFIDQLNSDAQTVVVSAEKGEVILGKLYWYTVDDAGNDSREESGSGKENGLNYASFILNNETLDAQIIVKDKTPALTDYEITLETNKNNVITYRWVGDYVVTPLKTYAGETIGSRYVTNGSGIRSILNGECTLQYTVTNSITGSKKTYSEKFIFDNEAPTLNITGMTSDIGPMAKFRLYAEDISGVDTLKYQLLTADGEAAGEETELSADLFAVTNEVAVAPEKTGAYKLRVTAIDNNGYVEVKETNAFSIRNAAPEIAVEGEFLTYVDSVPIVGEGTYGFNVSVEEAVDNINDFEGNQMLYYRMSLDGNDYTEWYSTEAKKEDGMFKAQAIVVSPFALNEGENIFYIQAFVGTRGIDAGKVSADLIGFNCDMKIIYDNSAPQYKLRIDDSEITNGSVYGTLTVTDNYSLPEDIKMYWGYGIVKVGEGEVSGNEITYPLEFDNNIYYEFGAADQNGNLTTIPVVVDCIDKEAPTVELKDSYTVYEGERSDYYLSFYVDEALPDNTKFALVEGYYAPSASINPETGTYDVPVVEPEDLENLDFDEENNAIIITNEENVFDYETGVTKTYYEVLIRADEEIIPEGTTDTNGDGKIDGNDDFDWNEWYELNYNNYILAVKAEDALGNTMTSSVGYGFTLTNATADISQMWANPEKAGSKTALSMELTVPAYVLPDSKVPAEIKAKNLEDGRIDESSDTQVAEFAEFVVNSATSYSADATTLISGYGDYSFYIADDAGRVYKRTVKVDEEMVTFGIDAPAIVKMYTAPEGVTDMTQWTESSPEALDFEDCDYYVVVEPDPSYTEGTVVLNDIVANNYDDNYNTDFSLDDGLSETDSNWNYTKLVYSLGETENLDRIFTYGTIVTIPATEQADEIVDYIGGAIEFNFKDVSAPDIYAYYSTTGYTNKDVYVTVTASDSDLAVSTDSADTETIGENDAVEVSADKAASAGISSIRVSGLLALDADTSDVSAIEMTDLGSVCETVLKFETNGKILVEAVNALGLVSYKEIVVKNINKEAIEEGVDYNLTYEYTDYEGNALPVEEDGYYKTVIAKLTVTEAGLERGVQIVNNGGIGEKTLDNYDSSFTFVVRDMYSNEVNADAEFTNFDLDGPIVQYSLATTAKTNKPVEVTLTANDVRSGTGNVELYDIEGNEITTVKVDDNNYTATLTKGGSYRITATDKLGNVSNKTFAVTNINTVKPNIESKVYTTEDMTTQMVGVKLYYDKQNVTLISANPIEGGTLSASDVFVDYNSSVVRFDDNGSVEVEFADDYGNTNMGVITVENINRTPPAVVPVAMVASDLLSVNIGFEMELDDDGLTVDKTGRGLEDLYVMHHGIAKKMREVKSEIVDGSLEETVTDAVYTVTENGKYKFYVYDYIGNTQIIEVTVDEIDKRKPQITSITWTYDYLDENGEMKNTSHTVTPVGEVGYNVAEDIYKPTNQDVKVIVETDLDTKFVGSSSTDYTTSHEVTYDENGWFNFYLERQNKLMVRYGIGIYLIDKIPPVIDEVEDLMFFENPKAGTPYSKDLLKYNAYDLKDGEKIDLNADVKIDYGTFNPDDISANVFDKNKPYEITYTVKDKVGNETVVKRKITLVGLFDTMARVNGIYPDSSGRIEVIGDSVEIALDNFSGTAYARYEKGVYTMGEMKHKGTVIPAAENGTFKLDKLTDGWYTFYIQTDLRDYFNINVYVYNK